MGAKRQEAINTQRPTDNATAAPGPKNDFSPTTLPRLAIYGATLTNVGANSRAGIECGATRV